MECALHLFNPYLGKKIVRALKQPQQHLAQNFPFANKSVQNNLLMIWFVLHLKWVKPVIREGDCHWKLCLKNLTISLSRTRRSIWWLRLGCLALLNNYRHKRLLKVRMNMKSLWIKISNNLILTNRILSTQRRQNQQPRKMLFNSLIFSNSIN
jgi:hypothetical protein